MLRNIWTRSLTDAASAISLRTPLNSTWWWWWRYVVSGRQKRGCPSQGVLTPHCRLDFYSPLNSITDYILVGSIGLQLKYFLNLAAELSLNSLKFHSNNVPDWWLGRKTLLRRGYSHVVEWLRKRRLSWPNLRYHKYLILKIWQVLYLTTGFSTDNTSTDPLKHCIFHTEVFDGQFWHSNFTKYAPCKFV
jgi:hypothetical protein